MANETQMLTIVQRIVEKTKDKSLRWSSSRVAPTYYVSKMGQYTFHLRSVSGIISTSDPELTIKRSDGSLVEKIGGGPTTTNALASMLSTGLQGGKFSALVKELWEIVSSDDEDAQELLRLLN